VRFPSFSNSGQGKFYFGEAIDIGRQGECPQHANNFQVRKKEKAEKLK
jgi:hypothetical protein